MDRVIEVKVFGNHLTKDNKNAGTKGEANVTKLRVTFNEGWDSYAKEIIFWDAYGENAVRITLTTNLLENIENSTRVYIVPIPAEAMARAGLLTFSIKGYLDGKRQVSTTSTLEVKDSPDILEPIDPTPTQAEQLQVEVDKVKEQLQGVIVNHTIVVENANKAEQKAKIAEESAIRAEATVGKTSYIGDNGNWYAWDEENNEFYDTGVKAQAGSTVYLGDNPPPEADIWVNPNEVAITEDYTQDEKQKLSDLPENAELQREFETKVDKTTYERDKVEIEETISSYGHRIGMNEDNIVALEDMINENTDEIRNYINAQTEILETDVEGLKKQMQEESHFRGYISTNAKIKLLEATPNDFVYSAESGTKWIYDEVEGWKDTGLEVPDQLTPASETTPLIDGTASAGSENAYARGDHRHPTDTTRASAEEFNSLKEEYHSDVPWLITNYDNLAMRVREVEISVQEIEENMSSALDELHNYAQALISGGVS